jgi:hypothetical protein
MNDQVKFKRIQDLAATVLAGIDELNLGNLSIDQLEVLTENSRELYERLVILRHKAYDQNIKGKESPAPEKVEEPSNGFSIPFKIETPVAPNQVSLIDAIEEVTKQEEIVATVEPVIEKPAPLVEKAVPPAMSVNSANAVAAESLNDRLSKAVGAVNTLAQKLEHTPIPDLKRAITLNQRFQFSKELFKGNNQDYEVAIDRLNSINRDEALSHLEQLKSKYAWNNESQVTLDFIDLIERRHQQL